MAKRRSARVSGDSARRTNSTTVVLRQPFLDDFRQVYLPRIIEGTKTQSPKLFSRLTKIAASTPIDVESVMEAVIEEGKESSKSRRLAAIWFIHEATKGQGPSGQLPVGQQQSAVEILKTLTCDKDLEVRRMAVAALCGFIGNRWDIDIARLLNESNLMRDEASVANEALDLLRTVGQDAAAEAVPALAVALRHHDLQVREQACRVLVQLGEDNYQAIPMLVQVAITDETRTVQLSAIDALLAGSETDNVATLLQQESSDAQLLLPLLREGGEGYRPLRQLLQRHCVRSSSEGSVVPNESLASDSGERTPIRLPANGLVVQLARLISKSRGDGRSRREIALEVAENDKRRADSILRQLRRYSHLLD